MLVPTTTSTGMWCSSSHSSTPTCAIPRAAPPPSASPIRGRVLSAWAPTLPAERAKTVSNASATMTRRPARCKSTLASHTEGTIHRLQSRPHADPRRQCRGEAFDRHRLKPARNLLSHSRFHSVFAGRPSSNCAGEAAHEMLAPMFLEAIDSALAWSGFTTSRSSGLARLRSRRSKAMSATRLRPFDADPAFEAGPCRHR